MKSLVLFLAAIASASSSGYKYIQMYDGSIVIDGENGKQVIISKEIGSDGQHVMEIKITGPKYFNKKIQINDDDERKGYYHNTPNLITENYRISPRIEDEADLQRTKRSKVSGSSKMDIFAEIMKEYQGVTDEASFETLMSKVKKAVQKGKIDSSVMDYLQFLTQDQSWSNTNKFGPEYMREPQKNQEWNFGQNAWQQYPYMGQNWQTRMLWPMTQWYQQKWMPERDMWQNDLYWKGVNGQTFWNQGMTEPNYKDWMQMKDMTYQKQPWMQQSINQGPVIYYPQEKTDSKYSMPSSYIGANWMDAQKWMNTNPWMNYKNWMDANSWNSQQYQHYPVNMKSS